jgi:hypothetical protein
MNSVRGASADEIVLAFLQGEVDSPAWIGRYTSALALVGADRAQIIDRGDITDAQQNADRRSVLAAVRGYGQDKYLFKGFPVDTDWRLVTATPAEVMRFKFINQATWIRLSAGTRLVADGVQNLDQAQIKEISDIRDKVTGIASDLKKGVKFLPLIAAQLAGASEIVLIDGHHRAAAYARTGSPNEIKVYIGTSARMGDWHWF